MDESMMMVMIMKKVEDDDDDNDSDDDSPNKGTTSDDLGMGMDDTATIRGHVLVLNTPISCPTQNNVVLRLV